MSALLPNQAVVLLYRRYLKASNKVTNATIRLLLINQVRLGFRRSKGVADPTIQRELVNQAHKDLQILEDERLSRTLFINKLGMVSCLDWEVRRTEYHFSPKIKMVINGGAVIVLFTLIAMCFSASTAEETSPDWIRAVDAMAARLEGNSPEEVLRRRKERYERVVEGHQRGLTLEERILATFDGAPAPPPSIRNPEARPQ
jgi:hypothetical protein